MNFRRLAAVALAALTAIALAAPASAAPTTTNTTSWALDRIDQTSRTLNGTYSYTDTGLGSRIYVVDTGITATSTDLTGRVGTGISLYTDQSTTDCWGSGTQLASLAAGTTYGVARQATVIPVRAHDCKGETNLKLLATAITRITAAHKPADRDVILLNLDNTLGKEAALDKAINAALKAAIPVVIPAGDRGVNPCAYSGYLNKDVIIVGATDQNDVRAQYPVTSSNYGPCVDIYAPGMNVPSATNTPDNGTTTVTGSAPAAALTAGWVARYLSANPAMPAANRIAWTNADLIETSTKNVVINSGINYPNRLLGAPTGSMLHVIPANAPAAIIAWATGTPGEIQIAWATPTTPGTSPITGYRITLTNTTGIIGATSQTVGLANIYTWTGLPADAPRQFKVQALSGTTAGTYSKPSNAIKLTATTPTVPLNVTSVPTATSAGSITVTWTAPANDGASTITGYQVYLTDSNNTVVTSQTTNSTTFTAQFNSLQVSKAYTANVKAINKIGRSTNATAAPISPYDLPGTPQNLNVTNPSKGNYKATWTAPATNGGTPVTGYLVRYSNDTGATWSQWTSTAALNTTFTTFVNGQTYLVQVAATTTAGTGAAAQTAVVVTNGVAS